jgi:hypothetical protein
MLFGRCRPKFPIRSERGTTLGSNCLFCLHSDSTTPRQHPARLEKPSSLQTHGLPARVLPWLIPHDSAFQPPVAPPVIRPCRRSEDRLTPLLLELLRRSPLVSRHASPVAVPPCPATLSRVAFHSPDCGWTGTRQSVQACSCPRFGVSAW